MRALPPRVRNYTVLTFSVGMLMFVFNLILLTSDPTLDMRPLGIIFFLFICLAVTPGVSIRRGERYTRYQFWEYPFIIGLTLGPPYAVAVAMTGTFGVLQAIRYIKAPESRTYIPVVFGYTAIGTTVGTYVAASAPPYTYPVGYLLSFVLCELFLFGLDYVRGDRSYAVWSARDGLLKRLVIPTFLSVTLTLMVAFIGPQRWFLMFAPLIVLLGYWAAQWRMDVTEQQAAWRQMESVSSKFIGELEEHKAITIALEESLKLFAARRAEIVLPGSVLEPGSKWSLEQGPNRGVEVEVLPPTTDPDFIPVPEQGARTEVIPLTMGERNFGYMVIEWDPSAPEKRARRLLTNTFGHSVAASIANTRHTKRISNQAAEKAREAERDPLTGLGNRAMLAERGPVLLSESADIHRSCALLLFDLDGFKRINDTLGHAAGDEVLVEVARRIKDTTRKNDLAIRLGGDEFAVLAVDMEVAADAERLAGKITKALIPPITVKDLDLSIESSIGVAIYPNDAEDIETLTKYADIAMYEAKSVGRGKTLRYRHDINRHTTESLSLATDLRRAVFASNELVLHYQPQVDVATNKVVGVEALIRWNHPTMGMLYPDKFVSIAERSNLVRPFTLAIIEQALRDRARMRTLMPDATVSVNLSAQNLLDTGLAIDVRKLLDKYQIDPSELVLEVTETTTAKDVLAADKVLKTLADLGCHIAMDDFGSGYATMESMRQDSPISEIKIDRGFIENITTSEKDCRVAKAIIEIAHAWECRVVAEGIENEETYLKLRELGCDTAQGYWLSRPAPLDAILEWVRARGTSAKPAATPALKPSVE